MDSSCSNFDQAGLVNVDDIKRDCANGSYDHIDTLSSDNVVWLEEIKEELIETSDFVQEKLETSKHPNVEDLNKTTDINSLQIDQILRKEQFKQAGKIVKYINNIIAKRGKTASDHNFYCDRCGEKFKIFCTKCPMLKRILDNNAKVDSARANLTIPKNILHLNKTAGRFSITSLQTIPKGVEFGPFDGIQSVSTETGSTWKVKDGKLVVDGGNEKFENWMRFINTASRSSEANLSIFEYDDGLYCKCEREIGKGEELLLYFGDQHSDCLKDDVETYLTPEIVTDIGDVYACSICCLGFSSDEYLIKHKVVCPNGKKVHLVADNIVRCSFCKIYLEEKEYSYSHVRYCCENYARKYLVSAALNGNTEIENQSSVTCQLMKIYNVVQKRHKCDECSYQTNDRHDLKKHQYKHANIKPFKCSVCKKQFTQKGHLKMHVKNHHVAVTDKEYKCRICTYQTNCKGDLKLHLYVHDTIKRFECEICGNRFRQKANLQVHLKNLHLAVDTKKFACPKCDFRTNYKNSLDKHVNNTHDDVTPLVCGVCNTSFKLPQALKQHIKYKHTPPTENVFKCLMCPYKAKRKGCLKRHISTHEEGKPFACTICCFRTNCKNNLRHHMYRHEEKPFSCDDCGKEFARKSGLEAHARIRHKCD